MEVGVEINVLTHELQKHIKYHNKVRSNAKKKKMQTLC